MALTFIYIETTSRIVNQDGLEINSRLEKFLKSMLNTKPQIKEAQGTPGANAKHKTKPTKQKYT